MVEISEEKLKQLKISIPKEVGNRVRFFRKKRGLTQTKLAQLVGKDRQYLYKIEKGVVTPNIFTISVIALTLEIPLNKFFEIEI